MTVATATKHMTYAEYLAWVGEDIRAEWVKGEVILLMPPFHPHQSLLGFLYQLIGLYVAVFNLGKVVVAPFELHLPDIPASRQPDLMFIATANLDRLTKERFTGPPDLIIEIVSNESVRRDKVDKFNEYQAAGVSEYWVLDNRPHKQQANFYQLDAHGQYQAIPPDADGIYHSHVLAGFWLRVAWLWDDLPNILRALTELIGPEQVAAAMRRAADN